MVHIGTARALNIERIDISIEKLRLSNVLYGSSEPAKLRCESGCWNAMNDDYLDGTLVLNGFGARFISMPKKNYRFNSGNDDRYD